MADYPGYGQSMSNGSGIMSVLQPFGDYLNEQIDVQRVDPFLETVSNAAYQEFGLKPDQGGGFFSGGFYKDGGGLPDRDLFGGGGMPHPDEGFDYSNPFPNMPQPIYERPTPDFPEGLFGGPLPNPDGRPQDDPVFGFGGFPTPQKPGFNDPITVGSLAIGNNGFGSVTQGPLDFMGGPNIAALANPEAGMAPTGTLSMQQPVNNEYIDYFRLPDGSRFSYDRRTRMAIPPGAVGVTQEEFMRLPVNPASSTSLLSASANPLSGFQGLGTMGLGGLQLARSQFG